MNWNQRKQKKIEARQQRAADKKIEQLSADGALKTLIDDMISLKNRQDELEHAVHWLGSLVNTLIVELRKEGLLKEWKTKDQLKKENAKPTTQEVKQ